MNRIGMVGVGLMGHGIAQNILKHGYTLTLLHHPGNQPLHALLSAGARALDSAAALAAVSDLVILCVTGSPEVEAVVFDPAGLLEGLRPGTIVVDCSTCLPSSGERVAEAVQARGGRFLDAPMTRTPREAAEGRLNLLVGGDAELLAACRPLLSCFAENITHCGPVGAGHRMKLLHNFVSLGALALLSEAAACALRAGIAPGVFVDVLAKGGGGGAALDRLKPYLMANDASSMRFAIVKAEKDLSYYATMAKQSDAVAVIGEAILETYSRAVAAGGAERFIPELVSILTTGGKHE
jgi:3-hydroxyisobutyrate dehydrogenase-like beta-hydroxyacid dehydrogenase